MATLLSSPAIRSINKSWVTSGTACPAHKSRPWPRAWRSIPLLSRVQRGIQEQYTDGATPAGRTQGGLAGAVGNGCTESATEITSSHLESPAASAGRCFCVCFLFHLSTDVRRPKLHFSSKQMMFTGLMCSQQHALGRGQHRRELTASCTISRQIPFLKCMHRLRFNDKHVCHD